ncbi:TetR/AcrR family transcriptional regulator [Mycolicibacterium flavescens]|uniref:TetR/AcrR family transcriptional regulator n=1 Tax=Mycolicibacterium flavescens TaxID=1776 RepID=UPI000A018AE2|nr:TetR/AcrR family transcriptional regulator [Mycolicibacterium flavescens]MCV7281775.1 TetR/AcrR family transcriptional regulator [Mycolicibacterium flavescens]
MPTRAARIQQVGPEREGVRDRLLKAAHELFTDLGYRATTTKEIAARAQVAELTLFRHFGSKVEVFEASVLAPLKSYIEQWSRSWVDFSTEASLEEMATRLVEGLYPLIRQDHRIFQELIAARSDPRSDLYPAAVSVSAELRKGLRAVHDASFDVANKYGIPGDDKPATIGAVAAMVIGSVVLEDWVYPAQRRIPGRERMVKELIRLIIDGTTHREKP